jgi:hypothetical protein
MKSKNILKHINLDKKDLRRYFWPALLTILALILYLQFASISYDDWDSIQFALGIKNFDLELHQPHSPGYPVYIFVLKILNTLINDPLKTMTVVSAFAGAIGVCSFYFLTKKIFNVSQEIHIASTILLMSFPLYAINSLKALSDTLAVALYIIWLLCFLNIYRKTTLKHTTQNLKQQSLHLVGFGLFTGIVTGVRIQIVVAMIVPILYLYWHLKKQDKIRQIIINVVGGIFGVLMWMIPVIYDTGGIGKFYKLMMGRYMWRYNVPGVTPFEQGLSIKHFIEQALKHIYFLLRSGIGLNLPYGSFPEIPQSIYITAIMAFLAISTATIYLILKNRKTEKVFLFLTSGLPYGIFMYMNLTYENARYWLPLIIYIVLFITFLAIKIQKLFKLEHLSFAILIILSIFFSLKTFELAQILHNEISAPTKAVNHIQNNYGEENVILIDCAHMNLRHLQYLTAKRLIFHENYSQEDINELNQKNPSKHIISCQCYKSEEILTDYERIETQTFYRDLRAHWKHNYIEICELAPK